MKVYKSLKEPLLSQSATCDGGQSFFFFLIAFVSSVFSTGETRSSAPENAVGLDFEPFAASSGFFSPGVESKGLFPPAWRESFPHPH